MRVRRENCGLSIRCENLGLYEVWAVRVACMLWGRTIASMFFTYLTYRITARGVATERACKKHTSVRQLQHDRTTFSNCQTSR
jgi:hypothetical protein